MKERARTSEVRVKLPILRDDRKWKMGQRKERSEWRSRLRLRYLHHK